MYQHLTNIKIVILFYIFFEKRRQICLPLIASSIFTLCTRQVTVHVLSVVNAVNLFFAQRFVIYRLLVPSEVRRCQVAFCVVVVQQVLVDGPRLIVPQQYVDQFLFPTFFPFPRDVDAKAKNEHSSEFEAQRNQIEVHASPKTTGVIGEYHDMMVYIVAWSRTHALTHARGQARTH